MDSRHPVMLGALCDDVRIAAAILTRQTLVRQALARPCREAHPTNPPVPFPDLDPEPDPLLSPLAARSTPATLSPSPVEARSMNVHLF